MNIQKQTQVIVNFSVSTTKNILKALKKETGPKSFTVKNIT